MNDKTIDLERIRRAHVRLDAYLAEHPEMRGESSESEWLEIVKGVIVTKQVFSVKEVAELLEVDGETIRRAIRKKTLKAAKIGKDYRISRQDFEAYYRQQGGGSLFGDEPERRACQQITTKEEQAMFEQTMLLEVHKDGEELELLDGRRLRVNPNDMPTCCTWTPTTTLEISTRGRDSAFPVRVRAIASGSEISAEWI